MPHGPISTVEVEAPMPLSVNLVRKRLVSLVLLLFLLSGSPELKQKASVHSRICSRATQQAGEAISHNSSRTNNNQMQRLATSAVFAPHFNDTCQANTFYSESNPKCETK